MSSFLFFYQAKIFTEYSEKNTETVARIFDLFHESKSSYTYLLIHTLKPFRMWRQVTQSILLWRSVPAKGHNIGNGSRYRQHRMKRLHSRVPRGRIWFCAMATVQDLVSLCWSLFRIWFRACIHWIIRYLREVYEITAASPPPSPSPFHPQMTTQPFQHASGWFCPKRIVDLGPV